MEIDLVRESPHQIIAEAISVMRVRAKQKGLSLDYNWSGPVPEQIQTDPSRLRQLLLNLIGNAIKFTKMGGVQVSVELLEGSPSHVLQIDVIDTGIGIPQEQIDEIFRPFSQVDASVTRQYGGTGLGLTISRRIAQALGGDLSVTSEPGNGSVFRIQVEAGELEGIEFLSQPPVSDFVSIESPSTVELPTLNGLRVLVVEDGRTNRRMVRLMLERAGAIMTEAENGKIGVNLATSNEYDIILMDMQMPVMDGYAATRALRLKGLQIPIIAFTAHAMSGDERKCREAGCSDYLSKPVNANQLIHKLGELANTRDAASSPTTSVTEPVEPIRSCLAYDDPDYREIIEDFIAMLNDRVGEMKLLLCLLYTSDAADE